MLTSLDEGANSPRQDRRWPYNVQQYGTKFCQQLFQNNWRWGCSLKQNRGLLKRWTKIPKQQHRYRLESRYLGSRHADLLSAQRWELSFWFRPGAINKQLINSWCFSCDEWRRGQRFFYRLTKTFSLTLPGKQPNAKAKCFWTYASLLALWAGQTKTRSHKIRSRN